MTLAPGMRLGPYEILRPLGAGGMGEVYSARDTRLDRTVAIKTLGTEFADDSEVRHRFSRESRAIAALDHPHICAIYDVGEHDGIHFIVMQHLEGETLETRLARIKGPMPVGQALKIAIEIGDALDKAHRAGITHRDLKPANVMLTKSGAKLLDFGVAKLRGAADPISIAGSTRLTTATPETALGTILGTVPYMAPEQLEGDEVDARADIWALGVMLYEMLTGVRPFIGESSASVIGSILKDTPPIISMVQPLAPASLDFIVKWCLEKHRDDRPQDVRDVVGQLRWIATTSDGAPGSTPSKRRSRSAIVWLAAATVAVIAATTAIAIRRSSIGAGTLPRMVFSVTPPDDVSFGSAHAVSPDGQRIVFVGQRREGPASLWVRGIDAVAARPVPGSDGAAFPFWSAHSDAIGFFADGKLKTVDLAGDRVRVVADAPNGRGGAWGEDGTILFVPAANEPIYRVPERGGPVAAATRIDGDHGEIGHRFPCFIDSRRFAYTVQSVSNSGIYIGSLDSPESTRLVPEYSNSAAVGNTLVYVLHGMLVSQRFDLDSRRLTGPPMEIGGPIAFVGGLGYAAFSVARNGLLTYMPSQTKATIESRWFDRRGTSLGPLTATELADYNSFYPVLSNDGRSLSLSVFRAATPDLWLLDLQRDVATRFTFDDSTEISPTWAPDGSELAFSALEGGVYQLYRKRVAAGGDATPLLKTSQSKYVTDWSRDGRIILFSTIDPRSHADLWMLNAAGAPEPRPVLVTPFNEYAARLSPDGQWIAYTSDESGKPEVYVQRFPSGSDRTKVSAGGGSEAQWRDDGRELFYVNGSKRVTAVPVDRSGSILAAGRATVLFDVRVDSSIGSFHSLHYAAFPDGQRFIVDVSTVTQVPVTVVVNALSESQR